MRKQTSPLALYRDEVERGTLREDAGQARIVLRLDDLHARLVHSVARGEGPIGKLRTLFGRTARAPVQGLYLWGGVGRGKTHLVNLFHDALPFAEKRRIHFHRFMQYVHAELKQLGRRADPLPIVADGLAAKVRVICFDEFHVGDIADAMLLGRLLDALFERCVTLVATSNIAPDDLYRGGLQRERFFPAIELIKRYTDVIHADGELDYRLRVLERAVTYRYPLDAAAAVGLQTSFAELGTDNPTHDVDLTIEGRPVRALHLADGIAWFAFRELCETPRSPADYISLARRFHTILVESIPQLDDDRPDRVVRFVHLVDELYDRNVNLMVSAAVPIDDLYRGNGLEQRFERTRSRLHEMQSRNYLARKHLP